MKAVVLALASLFVELSSAGTIADTLRAGTAPPVNLLNVGQARFRGVRVEVLADLDSFQSDEGRVDGGTSWVYIYFKPLPGQIVDPAKTNTSMAAGYQCWRQTGEMIDPNNPSIPKLVIAAANRVQGTEFPDGVNQYLYRMVCKR